MCARIHRTRLVVLAMAASTAVTCQGSPDNPNNPNNLDSVNTASLPGFDGVATVRLSNLVDPCAIDRVTGNLSLSVGADETVYLYERNGSVIANAYIGDVACAVAPSKRITIRSRDLTAQDDQKVIVDFQYGLFGLATKALVSTDPSSGPNI